jgi:hypothetical protein
MQHPGKGQVIDVAGATVDLGGAFLARNVAGDGGVPGQAPGDVST